MNKLLMIMFVMSLFLGSCHRQTLEEQCAEQIKREKRRLPRNAAQGLVLDSMRFVRDDKVLEYYYTMSDSLYSDEAIEANKDKFEQNMLEGIRNSIGLKKMIEQGVSFRHVYIGDLSKKVRLAQMFRNRDLVVQ